MAWKYVIVKVGNQEVPVIFPNHMIHSEMVQAMRLYYVRQAASMMPGGVLTEDAAVKLYDGIVPVSAGNLNMDVRVETGSRSETLGVGSRPLDTPFINAYPYHHGLVGDDADDGRYK